MVAVANPEKCVICLPSQNSSASQLCTEYSRELQSWGPYPIITIGMNPDDLKWFDEDTDIENTRKCLEEAVIANLQKHNIPKSKTFLIGFSEGAAMALELLSHTDEPYSGAMIHSGKIISEDLPECSCPTTEIVLTHNENDKVFTWNEDYLPMKNTLKDKGYNFRSEERNKGGHFYQVSLGVPVVMNRLILL